MWPPWRQEAGCKFRGATGGRAEEVDPTRKAGRDGGMFMKTLEDGRQNPFWAETILAGGRVSEFGERKFLSGPFLSQEGKKVLEQSDFVGWAPKSRISREPESVNDDDCAMNSMGDCY
jgi:hypothetical protein